MTEELEKCKCCKKSVSSLILTDCTWCYYGYQTCPLKKAIEGDMALREEITIEMALSNPIS